MIVIRRGVGEGLRLDIPGHGEVFVTIGRIANEKMAYLEIEAPRTVSICRGEIWAAINQVDDDDPGSL